MLHCQKRFQVLVMNIAAPVKSLINVASNLTIPALLGLCLVTMGHVDVVETMALLNVMRRGTLLQFSIAIV